MRRRCCLPPPMSLQKGEPGFRPRNAVFAVAPRAEGCGPSRPGPCPRRHVACGGAPAPPAPVPRRRGGRRRRRPAGAAGAAVRRAPEAPARGRPSGPRERAAAAAALSSVCAGGRRPPRGPAAPVVVRGGVREAAVGGHRGGGGRGPGAIRAAAGGLPGPPADRSAARAGELDLRPAAAARRGELLRAPHRPHRRAAGRPGDGGARRPARVRRGRAGGAPQRGVRPGRLLLHPGVDAHAQGHGPEAADVGGAAAPAAVPQVPAQGGPPGRRRPGGPGSRRPGGGEQNRPLRAGAAAGPAAVREDRALERRHGRVQAGRRPGLRRRGRSAEQGGPPAAAVVPHEGARRGRRHMVPVRPGRQGLQHRLARPGPPVHAGRSHVLHPDGGGPRARPLRRRRRRRAQPRAGHLRELLAWRNAHVVLRVLSVRGHQARDRIRGRPVLVPVPRFPGA
ncbi:MAG: hypothetical protein BJ554DRAFT_2499, partial [Olpidium bornovanus]